MYLEMLGSLALSHEPFRTFRTGESSYTSVLVSVLLPFAFKGECFTTGTANIILGGSLAVVRSYALGYEPLVAGYLTMGLTIRSSHKQELSSVYQFIDVLYSLCIYEALRH